MADCLFCKIVSGDIPATIVYRDDRLIAFKDINPQAPLHVLIIPRRHIPTLNDLGGKDDDLVGEMVRRAAAISPGSSDGRITFSSSLIGLASTHSEPPNACASASEMKLQVTASSSPRAAAVRRTRRSISCDRVAVGFATPGARASGIDGTLS